MGKYGQQMLLQIDKFSMPAAEQGKAPPPKARAVSRQAAKNRPIMEELQGE